MDSDAQETYQLKNSFYKDQTLEQRLCEKTINQSWNFLPSFFENIKKLQENKNNFNQSYPLLDHNFYLFLIEHRSSIEAIIEKVNSDTLVKPFQLTYFGLQTLKNKYLLKTHDGFHETPDYLWLRISLFIHKNNWDKVLQMYCDLRQGKYIHATPTLFNAGLVHHQMASCFLLGNEDSIKGIYKSIGDCAQISKFAGGIGLHCHTIRSNGSYIYGTNGRSNGIIPMLKVYNDTARYVDQGGGKRNGSFAIYLECWHSDIFDFLLLKKNFGSEETRARDLFYALWIPDFFMEAVENNLDWYLFDPSVAPDLNLVFDVEFKRLYQKYIIEERYSKKIKARELWREICRMQVETGTPYILYKDQCNRLSNQKNLGTIQSSNLCCEILQYSSHQEYAVCNLASISLPSCLVQNPKISSIESVQLISKENCFFCDLSKYFLRKYNIPFETLPSSNITRSSSYPSIFINDEYIGGFHELWSQFLRPHFDFEELGRITESLVDNLNLVIDKNMYPLPECKLSNFSHRPMGIGVQGLADVFMELLEPYDSVFSRNLNRKIFETMYFHALRKSNELAKLYGPYSSFPNSPLSNGKFHFELYTTSYPYPLHYDWESLRSSILQYGTRNSLLIALMPTASTSQILGNTESFEPLTSNFYVRRVLTGEYYVINRILQNLLKDLSIWNDSFQEKLIFDKGSIQKFSSIHPFLKSIFRTVWEIPQKHCIEMASERQRFIDQSQSMNIYLTNPSIELLTKIHFFGWKQGLKTGSYYIRSRALTNAQNFCFDAKKEEELRECESCSA